MGVVWAWSNYTRNFLYAKMVWHLLGGEKNLICIENFWTSSTLQAAVYSSKTIPPLHLKLEWVHDDVYPIPMPHDFVSRLLVPCILTSHCCYGGGTLWIMWASLPQCTLHSPSRMLIVLYGTRLYFLCLAISCQPERGMCKLCGHAMKIVSDQCIAHNCTHMPFCVANGYHSMWCSLRKFMGSRYVSAIGCALPRSCVGLYYYS